MKCSKFREGWDVDRAAIQSDMSVLGRFLITKKEADIASFKTPDLRNVLITAPYFHDGSQATLWDVMHAGTSSAINVLCILRHQR
jgi:cytochrome c peroxidase